MKKFVALIIGSVVLATASSANAIIVDPAAARVCLNGKPAGDEWNPNTSPHCVCGSGAGETERVNLMFPGPKYKDLVRKYGDTRDRCATVSEIKRGPKPEGNKKPDAPPPPPAKFAAMLTPGDKNDVKGGDTVKEALVVTSNGKLAAKFVASCSACLVNNENPLIVNNPQIPETGYVFNLTPTNPETALTATFNVKVIDKKGNELGSYSASVGWLAKAPPPPPPPPAPTACVASGGTDTVSRTTGMIGCSCIGEGLMEDPIRHICVPKPIPPPAKKIVEGTIVHPYAELLGGYGHSKSFHSDNYGLGVGAGFDASSYLRIFGGAGLELIGGTKLDANRQPVVLANGNVDKRRSSAFFILGLQLRPIEMLGINVGVVRQMRGTTGGVVNALSVTTGGSVGASVLLPIDGATFDLGADLLVGAHQLQSFAPDAEVGVIVRFRVWFFNSRHFVEVR